MLRSPRSPRPGVRRAASSRAPAPPAVPRRPAGRRGTAASRRPRPRPGSGRTAPTPERRARPGSRAGSRPSRTPWPRGSHHPTRRAPAPARRRPPTRTDPVRWASSAVRPAGPGTDVEDVLAGPHVEQPQHRLDRARLGVRLAVADLDRPVEAGARAVATRAGNRSGAPRPWRRRRHPSAHSTTGLLTRRKHARSRSRNTAPRQLRHVLPGARVVDRTPGSTSAARHTVRRSRPEHPGPADLSRPRSGDRRAGDQRSRGLDRGGGRRAREWCRRGRGERRTLHHSRPDRPADALAHRGPRRGDGPVAAARPCWRSCWVRTRRSGAPPSTRGPRRSARSRSPPTGSRRRPGPRRWSTTRRRAASSRGSGATSSVSPPSR